MGSSQVGLTERQHVRAQRVVAQEQATPDQRAHHDREDQRDDARAGPHVRGHRAAQVARQQDRAKQGGARKSVDGQANELQHADTEDDIGGIAELRCRLDGRRGMRQISDRKDPRCRAEPAPPSSAHRSSSHQLAHQPLPADAELPSLLR